MEFKKEDTFVYDITNKYLRHLGSIERLKESYKLLDKERLKPESNIGGLVEYLAQLKMAMIHAADTKNQELESEYKGVYAELLESEIVRNIDKKIVIHKTENDIGFSIKSGILVNAYNDHKESTLDLEYDDTHYQNSLIISLVTGLEMLVAEIFKDYVNSMDKSNQILKNRTLSYNHLKEIGSVSEAKSFLMDEYLEKTLRKSFNDWLNQIDKEIQINFSNNEVIKHDIDLINETVQRRHIIIHNNGVVNDLYLNKISDSLKENISKGEDLFTDPYYIDERIGVFRKFGLILIYLYGLKK